MSLYVFEADKDGKSTCEGLCANAWPPLLIPEGQTAELVLDSGLDNSLLSNTTRADGKLQVVWDKMPLYYFVRDAKVGDILGEGVKSSGDLWWLVKPTGGYLFSNGTATEEPMSDNAPANETLPSN